MARVLLIDPPGWQGAASGNHPSPNVGLAYLAASLRMNRQDVGILDLNNQPLATNQVLAKVLEFKPDILGLSVKTATLNSARHLGSTIREKLPRVVQVVGGPHTKFAWRDLLRESWIDMVFMGEGEVRFAELCHRIEQGKSFDDIPGVLVPDDTGREDIAESPLIESGQLDFLPYPDYDFFPKNVVENLRVSYPLVTSRGCVYRCIYCSVPAISGRKFRKRSPDELILELEHAREKYRTEEFEILDDVFNLDIDRCKRICRALIQSGLNMRWTCPNGIRADRIDLELAELMFESGCRKVMVGVESADAPVLRAANKGEDIADIEEGIHILQGTGIAVGAYFIIGLPGDSIRSEMESVRFVKRMGIDAHFNMLVPYPGTELWKWARKNARFLKTTDGSFHFSTCIGDIAPAIETDEFSAAERLQAYAMVHTKLDKLAMLVPPYLPFWRRYLTALGLYWKYDREHLPEKLSKGFLTLCRSAIGLARRGEDRPTRDTAIKEVTP